MSKSTAGKFFEDFRVGHALKHPTARTITAGDVALYGALSGTRFAVQASDPFALAIGFPRAPVDDLFVLNVVLGQTAPDVSHNAAADLGYANCRFLSPVYPGDTLSAASEVIGLKENSDRKAGVVYVRSIGLRQDGAAVLDFVRSVVLPKRDEKALIMAADKVPSLPAVIDANGIGRACPPLSLANYDFALSGSPHRFGDYAVGEKIDHHDGTTVEEAEHPIAARLYRNTARLHADALEARRQRFGRRPICGGHVLALVRALTFNGLANAFHVAAINGGRHLAPLFAGETVYAWSEVLAKAGLPGRDDVGALRLRTVAAKDRSCADFPDRQDDEGDSAVVLELDYWVLMPR
jgi:2-methylfumaryl-CoA hydratase